MDVLQSKIIKKLGSGVMGTVYLSNINGEEAITKIEKYDGDMTTKSPFVRQLIFDEQVAKKYPHRFMTLISGSILNDCKHKQKLPSFVKNAPPKIKAYHKLRESWNKCSVLSYRPVLKYTLNEIKDKLSPKKKVEAFEYLKESVEIMQKHGFIHRDLHHGNIMCDKLSGKIKWYIIDYGAIYNSSFIKNTDDEIMGTTSYDLNSLIWTFIDNPVFEYIVKHDMQTPPFKKIIKCITTNDKFKNIKKYLPKKIKKTDVMYNEYICLICAILYYDLYIDSIGMAETTVGKKYKNFKQPNCDYFLHIIKKLKM